MDLRNLPHHLSSAERCEERRRQIEQECDIDLSALQIDPTKLGHAEEQNCEQMFGHVPIPVGYAGPLPLTFSSGEYADIHLPLATTEGALVASVNRGCKALRLSGGVKTTSVYHGVTRSIAFRRVMVSGDEPSRRQSCRPFDSAQGDMIIDAIEKTCNEWKSIGEATSNHLKILKYDIDTEDDYLFLTIYADTDEAMGMNMVTIAAEAIGKWLEQNINRCVTLSGVEERPTIEFITVAANVDSDKKPSERTHDRGRGYEVTATATVPADILQSVLKTTPENFLEVAHAKLELGSEIAGAIGRNCHAANIIAALYLATGQDPAHVVEGSLADTIVRWPWFDSAHHDTTNQSNVSSRAPCHPERVIPSGVEGRGTRGGTLHITVRLPALLLGIRGGGTTLPAQSQALCLFLPPTPYSLHPRQRLAESIGAAVLASELSLLAALSSHSLGKAHQNLGRGQKAKRVQRYGSILSCQ
ncbi:hypothetical protein HY464_00270 [Candidatus Peregrinibacteria bacterium]|nr:hypothetical protein [Candidatus Peregrinibacteria bacterium]